MKKGFVIFVCLVLVLSMAFVSANLFSDFWAKITGKQVSFSEDSALQK